MSSTWGSYTWGQGNWGENANATLTLSGLTMTSALGAVQQANVGEATGIALTPAIGSSSITADANVTLTGLSSTLSFGSFSATPSQEVALTGLSLSLTLGNAADVVSTPILVNGFNLTSSLGTTAITGWAEVNRGSTSTWAEVDKAA
jgi:hypothetical protein